MDCIKSICILTALLALSCSKDATDYDAIIDQNLRDAIEKYSPDGTVSYYILPADNQLDLIPQDRSNILNAPKVELGKFLFYETGLAREAIHEEGLLSYSCASCHIPESGFRPDRIQGIADGGLGMGSERTMQNNYSENQLDIQGIRPLSLLNVAFVSNTFWNGQFGSGNVNIGTEHLWNEHDASALNELGFEAIETQNIEGLEVHRINLTREIADEYNYTDIIDECFNHIPPEERYSRFTASQAISAYIRTLISNQAPFQDWLNGNSAAMSNHEKEGAILFFGKAKCASCHYEKNLGSMEFHVLGAKDLDQHDEALNRNPDDLRNLGRGGFTANPEDMHAFKVPGLYNISDAAFYFHGSSKTSIEDVIYYKLNALRENPRVSQLRMSEKLHKITLDENEVYKLKLFLEKSLRDPDLTRYVPDHIKSGLCFPNNDEESRKILGCE